MTLLNTPQSLGTCANQFIYINIMQKVTLTPTKAVQDRINKEAKKDSVKAAQLAKRALNKSVNKEMDEALRGLNASAKYLSSVEGINTISKKVEGFEGKVSKGSLLEAFRSLDNLKQRNATKNGKKASNLILVMNNGTRRSQYSNAQLIAAAKHITANKVVETLG